MKLISSSFWGRAFFFGVAAVAATVSSAGDMTNEPIFTITVAKGVTNLCSEVAVVKHVTGEADETLTFAEFAALDTTGTLQKEGEGCLKVDQAISKFKGQIHVNDGIYYVRAIGARGWTCASGTQPSEDDAVYVHDGATLFMDATFNTESSFLAEQKMHVISGTGYEGLGALHCYDTKASRVTGWPSGYTQLAADAKIVHDVCGSGQRLSLSSSAKPAQWIKCNGHQLLIERGPSFAKTATPDFNHNAVSVYGGQGGTILVTNVWYHLQNSANLQDGESSRLIISQIGCMTLESMSKPKLTWTLQSGLPGESGATQLNVGYYGKEVADYTGYSAKNGQTNHNVWSGPVVLNRSLALQRSGNKVRYGCVFRGPVSGVGGFKPNSKTRTSATYGGLLVHLVNPENTFQGGVDLNDGALCLYGNGTLPKDGGNTYLYNSDLCLNRSDTPYELPSATFEVTATGTGRVNSVLGAWSGAVTKLGAGRLDYLTSVGGPLLDIQAGSVRFANAQAGLIEGQHDYAKDTSGKSAGISGNLDNREVFTNALSTTLEKINFSAADRLSVGFEPKDRVTYSGYIFNDAETDSNWSVGSSFMQGFRIIMDDKVAFYGNTDTSQKKAKFATFTVTPGWHKIEMAAYRNSSVATGLGPIDTVTNATWGTDFAIGLDRQGRGSTDQADYEKIVDPGDGSFLVCSTNAEEAAQLFAPKFAKIKLASGTLLDLGGTHYPAVDVESTGGIVSNGVLAVNGALNVVVDELDAAKPALTVKGELKFGPDATIAFDAESRPQNAKTFRYATATGGITGCPEVVDATGKWSAKVVGNDLTLTWQQGVILIVR